MTAPQTEYNRARIRLEEESAFLLQDILEREEKRLLDERRDLKNAGEDYEFQQRSITAVRRMLAEVRRVLSRWPAG